MKVGILGSGFVGATAAYALVMRGVGREIVLVDKNHARALAEADDIRHAVPFAHPLNIDAGAYADLKGCRVVVVCAGVGQKPGETRLQLLQRNAAVFREVIPAALKHAPDAVLAVATNPVDVMTHLAARFASECGVAPGRVLGSGTMLDTARFRSLLAGHCGVDSHHVHANVIGEHGDSEVLTWSLATIGGLPLEKFAKLRGIDMSEPIRKDIDAKVRGAAYTIITGKNATYYGIGSALARLVEAILQDQRAVLTVGAPTADVVGVRNVTVSLPRLVGGQGVLETFPLPLSELETTQLRASAGVIRTALDELGGTLKGTAMASADPGQRDRWWNVPALIFCVLTGALLGAGAYTVHYAEGLSYLSTDPKSCVNCHIMRDQYDGWQHSSHHAVATCADCHVPHAFVPKYYVKAENGFWHSKGFTLQDFPEPIRLRPVSLHILEKNCLHCHGDLVSGIVGHDSAGVQTPSCVHCHASVGHGPQK